VNLLHGILLLPKNLVKQTVSEKRFACRKINKSPNKAYNKVVESITVTENGENRSNITYLYNAVTSCLQRYGGKSELIFGEDRAALMITAEKSAERDVRAYTKEKIAEVIGIGYKFEFLKNRLRVCLGQREKKLLLAALIAADLDGDKAYIRGKLDHSEEYSIDGFYAFRLGALREKWEKIAAYIPEGFASNDLKKFCDFLVGESHNKIYIKGNAVFGENFVPLRRSRLTGEEDIETEIMLSDAGFVYCLGEVEDSVGDFLQKYYAERAIFS
jgi:hypothetical protein